MENYGYETDSEDELALSATDIDSDQEIELFCQTNSEINLIDPYILQLITYNFLAHFNLPQNLKCKLFPGSLAMDKLRKAICGKNDKNLTDLVDLTGT